jgi:hypothetical protein
MGHAARERAVAEFARAIYAQRHLDLYRRVAGETGAIAQSSA